MIDSATIRVSRRVAEAVKAGLASRTRPVKQTRSRADRCRGYWVPVGGGGRRYVLPRLTARQFALLLELDGRWDAYLAARSDRRTRRSLQDRGLAEFREHAFGVVEGRLTNPGLDVRNAWQRKVVRRAARGLQAERRPTVRRTELPGGERTTPDGRGRG